LAYSELKSQHGKSKFHRPLAKKKEKNGLWERAQRRGREPNTRDKNGLKPNTWRVVKTGK